MRARIEESALGARETVALLARALRYVAPFRVRFGVKLGLGLVSLLPLVILPWPVKLIVDQVIEDLPVGAAKTPYPFFIRPWIDALAGSSPGEMIAWAIGLQALLLLLVGAIGTSSRERDGSDAYLSGGHDTATTTENQANAGFSLMGGLLGYCDFRYTIRLTQDLNHHYRSRLFERIQSLPMSVFDDERIGDAVYRVMYDTPAITTGVYRIILTPILSVFAISITLGAIALVFGDHPALVATAFAYLPLSLFATLPFAGAVRRRSEASRKAGATTTATMEEGLTNILAVQSLGAEDRERDRFDRDSESSFREYRHIVRLSLVAFVCAFLPGLVLFGYAMLYAVDLVISGAISRGDFTLLLTYFFIVVGSAIEIGALWFNLQNAAPGLHRVFFLMDLPREVDAEGAVELEDVREGVRFENVSFAFDDGTQALQEVSVEARVGELTALVGPAGAGKTTLAYLLCGYHAPTTGTVRIDGHDLAALTRESVRRRIAFVFQETALFDETVEENLRLGKPDASETEIRLAARVAGADGFIRALPQGYRTRLGRAGGKLSVGQKQRLSIARALVCDAPILVLDEPTSALDPETERDLVAALREASRDRLVLVIAHRMSTVRHADCIHFLESGRIVESGRHGELMARAGGRYRRFVELQSRGAA